MFLTQPRAGILTPSGGKKRLLGWTSVMALFLPRWKNTPFGRRGCNVFAWITGALKSPNYNQTLYAQTV